MDGHRGRPGGSFRVGRSTDLAEWVSGRSDRRGQRVGTRESGENLSSFTFRVKDMTSTRVGVGLSPRSRDRWRENQ